jgi:cyclopropane fatty-acyl-phospholipid synthase-like methyltransferase
MNILEPMCGSGRVLVPFAKKGYNIDGFDLSEEMLERCRIKIKEIENKCTLSRCDFLEYTPKKHYDFIFITSCSFSLIIEKEKIQLYLEHLKKLAVPKGKIVLEVLIEEKINFLKNDNSQKIVKEGNKEIILSEKLIKIDEINNITYSSLEYELFEDNKLIEKEDQNFNIKYYQPNELEMYLKKAGLKINNKYIDYLKTKYEGQETKMLIYELNNEIV